MKKKVNMNFELSFLEKIDKIAKDKGLNRTQFVTFILLTYFNNLDRKENESYGK